MASNAISARPFTTFNFVVLIDVDGVANGSTQVCAASFSECDGLEMTLEPKTIRAGGRNWGPVHLAGGVSYGQLALKRGMTTNLDLWKWFEKMVQNGQTGYRTSATVVIRASDQSDLAVFQLTGCLPVKLKAPALNAKDGLVAIEEMQIAYESLSLQGS
ncbi:phage tail-like protein [Edaphobacter aggregans]|uniref:Phage tail-like protein n=1 Tax=Edaphobacter aggregans TaxID=570835 RepID=A0A3R9NYW3_9BACT|nr:phage tail protein [Edaphobacter aggregans]RSL17982.1 phage tail-like protein [Edaphobacter aggregans]